MTQQFLAEVQLQDLRLMQRQEKFNKVCQEQERMHKHLMNRVKVEPPKDGNLEDYVKFLQQKDAEFS